MRLTELGPRWFDVPGIGTDKDGVTFLCPCARCLSAPRDEHMARGGPYRLAAQFANPVGADPKPLMSQKEKMYHVHDLRTFDVPPGYLWKRTGETFETLTLSPSVDASASGHWHGHITNGEVI